MVDDEVYRHTSERAHFQRRIRRLEGALRKAPKPNEAKFAAAYEMWWREERNAALLDWEKKK